MAKSRLTREPHLSRLSIWIPVVISVVALCLSGYEFYDNHKRNIALDKPRVEVVQSLDEDDPEVGLKIMNLGTAPATIKDITFYVDRKPADLETVIAEGKLPDSSTTEFDENDTLGVGETEWLLSLRPSKTPKKDLDRFMTFIDDHVAVQTNVCSITTGKCEIQCSAPDWCK